MAKYRVIKTTAFFDNKEEFHVQKKHWFTGKWHTIADFTYIENALVCFSRYSGADLPGQEVIVESK